LLNLAEIVADFVAVTWVVPIANVVDDILAGTITVDGMAEILVLLVPKFTVLPSGGAGPPRVTVPITGVPPLTEVELKVSELSTATLTVKLALLVVVP
jgi:hypothetical protein